METNLIFKRLGNYSMFQAGNEECCKCNNADMGDILVDITKQYDFPVGSKEKRHICIKCLLNHYFRGYSKDLSPYMPAHVDYDDNCCGIFNAIKDDVVVCNECGMSLTELVEKINIKPMNLQNMLNVISETYGEDYILNINMNGVCGIESQSGQIEIDFGSLGELYRWILSKCKKCGQIPAGQGGEYPCSECGIPTVHDEDWGGK